MTEESYEKACELKMCIEDAQNAIDEINNWKLSCSGSYPLNFSFNYDDDMDALKASCIKHLKERKAKFEREFKALR